MVVEIVSIVLSCLTSVVAIVVSIVSIRQQTKSQNINASIQLFDKRFEIYKFTCDLWYIVGYLEAGLNINNKKHNFSEIIELVNEIEFTSEFKNRIENAYVNSRKYEIMQECLFAGKVQDYLKNLLSAFSIYINGVYHKASIDKEFENKAYKKLFNLYKKQSIDMKELKDYINLSDIKRLDV
ncbi:MAG: hypothetical protein E7376_02335 [Clostridiales bacterium]|nr:hypothetical protein [Clostridiales bacterium]